MSQNGDEFRGDEVIPEEDVLGDEVPANDDEEGEGEDLYGDNMLRDYERRPELDQYDPAMLDDAEHSPMSIAARRAADAAMDARDGRDGEGSPIDRPRRPYSPEHGSEVDGSEVDPASTQPRKRRRTSSSPSASPGPMEDGDLQDEQLPESYYDLSKESESMKEDSQKIDKRVEQKIRRNFQQFLLHFTLEGQNEPKYPDLLRKMAEEHQRHLDVSFQHMLQWSPTLALWVADFPTRILPILNETLMSETERRFKTYQKIRATEEKELRVAIHNFPTREPIRELCTKHLNRLISVHGVVTKRTGVCNQVKRLWLRCAKCNFPSGPFEVTEEKDLKPGSCIECQSKGPWRVDRQKTLYRNFQKITLQESPSSVEPGKMPRSKEVTLTGDQVDSVRPGDDIVLTGVYRCLYDATTNARTCFPVYRTEIDSVHVKRKGDVKGEGITEDVQSQLQELAKKPDIRDRIIASMAPSIYGMTHVKTAIALSMFGGQPKVASGRHRIRGDINALIVGDPGLAKSQFLKYIEGTFPRAVYTTGKGASAVGLTAAVTRDESGGWVLEGGAMVLADDGICLIDEFDKMNDQDRTSIHEAMEQQSISISKAGIVASLSARCAVVAVANPIEGRYDPQQTFAANVNLSDPILSRFDVLCVLRDESDPVQDERLADHVVCSHIRSHPEATPDDKLVKPKLQQKASLSTAQPIDQELLQKYIIYARTRVFPKIADMDFDKLSSFYKDIRDEAFRSGGVPMTARHVDGIVRLAEASARMELRQHVSQKDLDFAISVVFESFVQSQKHQVAEELRKRFRRYLVQATAQSDQLMNLLEKLFKDKAAQMRLSRPDGQSPELGEVPINMADVVAAIERYDFDITEAHSFMRTDRFRQNFRMDGERMFRII
eukprot:gnl/TRDRNA2_/TRDRNA2_37270_c0_seq1.p1 gnl/TRDRNA2_/TRDRNA2_37270_c0~~gnl/TRDRNA2_/TRDRNA2_37270_c0_seq1.p1  ORF type:complete len:890 (+),score=215.87 gnl/TRDRNA2_/TRDRNA2_37270_c0_seq1:88-2757(+)